MSTVQLQKLKELAEFKKNFCGKCGKKRYYTITVSGQQQQVEHEHKKAPVYAYEYRETRDALELGMFRAVEDIPAYQAGPKTFLLSLPSLDLFQRIVDTIALFTEESRFWIGPAGLRFTSMDTSHIMLLDVHVPPGKCEHFDVPDSAQFTVRVEDLKTTIARGNKNEPVYISMNERDEPDQVFLRVFSKGGRKKEYGLHLIESGIGQCPLPKLDFDAVSVFDVRAFKEVLEDVEVVSDQVTMNALPDGVSFFSKSDIGKVNTHIDKNSADILEHACSREATSTYSISHITNFLSKLKPEVVSTQFSTNKPIVVRLNLEPGYVDFYLAPRVGDQPSRRPEQPEPPDEGPEVPHQPELCGGDDESCGEECKCPCEACKAACESCAEIDNGEDGVQETSQEPQTATETDGEVPVQTATEEA